MNKIYLHDAGTGRLMIAECSDGYTEEEVEQLAVEEDMRWGDVSWGEVISFDIKL